MNASLSRRCRRGWRVAQVLLQLADNYEGELPANLTHEKISTLAGTTRSTVAKVLSQFAGQGAVDLGYRKLRILDRQALERETGGALGVTG